MSPWMTAFLIAVALGLVAKGWLILLDRRDARYVDRKVSATRDLQAILIEAEWGQYVPLEGVDGGRIRTIDYRLFVPPPPGEAVVMVGNWGTAQHAIITLRLNPARVTIAEYPWRLFNLPRGLRVIMLPDAEDLPQIEGVLTNLRALGSARYVRLEV